MAIERKTIEVMEPTRKTIYVTSDGKEFNHELNAQKHEIWLELDLENRVTFDDKMWFYFESNDKAMEILHKLEIYYDCSQPGRSSFDLGSGFYGIRVGSDYDDWSRTNERYLIISDGRTYEKDVDSLYKRYQESISKFHAYIDMRAGLMDRDTTY